MIFLYLFLVRPICCEACSSTILGSIGIKWGIGFKRYRLTIVKISLLSLENYLWYLLVSFPQEMDGLSYNFSLVWHIFFSFFYFIVSVMSQKKLFFVLNCRGNSFSYVKENFPQSNLIIIRECPQNNITHILRYFNSKFSPDSIYLDPLHPTPSTHIHTSSSTPL